MERQTELLVCTDPAGTEVWSDYAYAKLDNLPGFGSVEVASAAAKRAAEAHLACDENWSGQPPWEPEREGNL